jgi:hypothetical protein
VSLMEKCFINYVSFINLCFLLLRCVVRKSEVNRLWSCDLHYTQSHFIIFIYQLFFDYKYFHTLADIVLTSLFIPFHIISVRSLQINLYILDWKSVGSLQINLYLLDWFDSLMRWFNRLMVSQFVTRWMILMRDITGLVIACAAIVRFDQSTKADIDFQSTIFFRSFSFSCFSCVSVQSTYRLTRWTSTNNNTFTTLHIHFSQ